MTLRAREVAAGFPRVPDTVPTRPASGDAIATVAIASYANGAVAMSLDDGKQLTLSPGARDHIATTERPKKVIVAVRALLRRPPR